MKSKSVCITAILFVLGLLFAASIQAQDQPPKPTPDPVVNLDVETMAAENSRVKAIGVKALKVGIGAGIKSLKKKVFNRNEKRIEAMEIVQSDDELLEIWIGEKTPSFQRSLGSTTLEFGDGALLEKWLDFLGSEGFKDFLDTLIPAIEKLIDIIGKLL